MTRVQPRYCPQCGHALEWHDRFGRSRPVCPACDHTVFLDPKVAVVVFVTLGDAVLLVRRRNAPGAGQWALPAGFVDPDEDPAAAAAREAAEETGIRVGITELIRLYHRPDPEGLADIVIAYRAEPLDNIPRAGDDADAAGWFSGADLDALPIALATTRRLLAAWRAGTL